MKYSMRKLHYIGAFNGILIDLLSPVYIPHPAELLRCPPVQFQLPARSPASPSPPPAPPPGTCTWPPPATHVMCILIQMRSEWVNEWLKNRSNVHINIWLTASHTTAATPSCFQSWLRWRSRLANRNCADELCSLESAGKGLSTYGTRAML